MTSNKQLSLFVCIVIAVFITLAGKIALDLIKHYISKQVYIAIAETVNEFIPILNAEEEYRDEHGQYTKDLTATGYKPPAKSSCSYLIACAGPQSFVARAISKKDGDNWYMAVCKGVPQKIRSGDPVIDDLFSDDCQ